MLFKARITYDTVKDENKLCEQLYIFLNEYVPNRLRYESRDEQEDCIQEAILYALSRLKKVEQARLKKINVEKFFYNITRSFVSGYIDKLKVRRKQKKNYLENKAYIDMMSYEFEEFPDYNIINSIIDKYNFKEDHKEKLLFTVNKGLIDLGYSVDQISIDTPVEQVFTDLSYPVIDEYMVKSAGGE